MSYENQLESDFDLNIDNYKTHELLNLLNLYNASSSSGNDNIEYVLMSLSDSTIDEKIQDTIDNLVQINEDEDGDNKLSRRQLEEFKLFFQKVKNTLLLEKKTIEDEHNRKRLFMKDDTISIPNPVTQNFKLPHSTTNTKLIKLYDIHIDSIFRDDTSISSTDFIYTLPNPLTNITSMRLNSACVPNTWFTVNESNNTFLIDDVEYQLETGNYNHEIMVNKWNKAGFPCRIEYNYIKSTFRIFHSSAGTSFKLTFPKVKYNFSLATILGFKDNEYSGSDSYLGEYVSQLNGDEYIYLCVDEGISNRYANKQLICLKNQVGIDDHVFAKFYMNHEKYYINIEDNNDSTFLDGKKRVYDGTVNIDKVKIKVLNRYGDVVDLRGNDISLTLQFSGF